MGNQDGVILNFGILKAMGSPLYPETEPKNWSSLLLILRYGVSRVQGSGDLLLGHIHSKGRLSLPSLHLP